MVVLFLVFKRHLHTLLQTSLIAQLVKNLPAVQETRFKYWVGKICWRRDMLPTPVFLGFPCGSAGKESACNVGDLGSTPGLGRSPGEGKGYPLQYSGLENSMNCIVHGSARSWTWLSNFHFTESTILHENQVPIGLTVLFPEPMISLQGEWASILYHLGVGHRTRTCDVFGQRAWWWDPTTSAVIPAFKSLVTITLFILPSTGRVWVCEVQLEAGSKKTLEISPLRHMHPNVHRSTVYHSQDMEAT